MWPDVLLDLSQDRQGNAPITANCAWDMDSCPYGTRSKALQTLVLMLI